MNPLLMNPLHRILLTLLAGLLLLTGCADAPELPAEGRWLLDQEETLDTIEDESERETIAMALDMMGAFELEVDDEGIRVTGMPAGQEALPLEQLGECVEGTRVSYRSEEERLALGECNAMEGGLGDTKLIFRPADED